ncbi:hypothetical protein MASR2M15_22300 [Anaerolineales bacterium]
MSKRSYYVIAVLILLIAAGLRLGQLQTLPYGLHQAEVTSVRLSETIRETGLIELSYKLHNQHIPGLYHVGLSLFTGVTGTGVLTYRILSVWFGLLSIALSFAVMKRLFNSLAAISAMSIITVSMNHLILSREIASDNILPSLLLATLFAITLIFPIFPRRRDESLTSIAAAGLGILLGIGVYINLMSLAFILILVIFIVYLLIVHRERMDTKIFSDIRFSLVILLIVLVPYLVAIFRDPSIISQSNRQISSVAHALEQFINGFLGIFYRGDLNPIHNLAGRPLVDPLSALLALLGLLISLRYWRQPRYALCIITFIVLAPVAWLVPNSPNFLLFSLITPVISIFIGITLYTFARQNKISQKLLLLMVMVLFAFNLVRLIQDRQIWAHLPVVRQLYHSDQGQIALYTDHTDQSIPTIVCYTEWANTITQKSLDNARLIYLMLNNKSAPVRYVDCRYGILFAEGGANQQIIFPDELTRQTMDPYLYSWVEKGAAIEGDIPANSVIYLSVEDELADVLGKFTTLAPINYAPEVAPHLSPQERLTFPPVQFGGNLTLLGYDNTTIPNTYEMGSTVPVITYWRVEGNVPKDLTLFSHILIDPVTVGAQHDVLSLNPNRLEARDVFIQITTIQLPDHLIPGDYTVSIGAYESTRNNRLRVIKDGVPYGDRLFLYTIMLKDRPNNSETPSTTNPESSSDS